MSEIIKKPTSREYGRRFYVDDTESDQHVDRMKRVTDMQVYGMWLEKHSEFKKPYYSPSYPDMEYAYSPIYPGSPWYPDLPGPTIIVTPGDEPGPFIVHPGDGPEEGDPTLCPGGLFCLGQNPSYIYRGESADFGVDGCPASSSSSSVTAEVTSGTATVTTQPVDVSGKGQWVGVIAVGAAATGTVSVQFKQKTRVLSSGLPVWKYYYTTCTFSVRCYCVGDLAFDDASTADTIGQSSEIDIVFTGGCPTYSWTVSGTGYTLDSATTTTPVNGLNADETACGTATISVTDDCGQTETCYIRGTVGRWVLKTQNVCTMGGTGTYMSEGPGYVNYELIGGKGKQEQTSVVSHGNYGYGCEAGCDYYCSEWWVSPPNQSANCIDPCTYQACSPSYNCRCDSGDPDHYWCWATSIGSLDYYEWEC